MNKPVISGLNPEIWQAWCTTDWPSIAIKHFLYFTRQNIQNSVQNSCQVTFGFEYTIFVCCCCCCCCCCCLCFLFKWASCNWLTKKWTKRLLKLWGKTISGETTQCGREIGQNYPLLATQKSLLVVDHSADDIFLVLWKQWTNSGLFRIYEPLHNKMSVRPAKTQVIKDFDVRIKKAWVLSYPLSTQRRLWSNWADARLSLRWAHSYFVGFVMSRLI